MQDGGRGSFVVEGLEPRSSRDEDCGRVLGRGSRQGATRREGKIKVHEAIAGAVSRLGVDAVFGLIGSGNFGLVDHMTRHCGVSFHASRHEAGAVAMADGYARVSGRLGVCTVHQGPGVTNTLTVLLLFVREYRGEVREPVLAGRRLQREPG
jgi:hypothetical protein